MKKHLLFYFLMAIIALGAIWMVFSSAGYSDSSQYAVNALSVKNETIQTGFRHYVDKILQAPGILILQLIVIMLVARLMGYLFQLFGQPMVVGEIVAGILLGPSVLGAILPNATAFLFPVRSIDILQQLSQLGLIFFMFIIGMELDTRSFRKSANSALLISMASIVIPFLSGILLAFYLYPGYIDQHVKFTSFALFMGITMSITAFPILARIVQERKLTRTIVGTMAISVAAIGDVVAWCILAVVIAIVKSGGISHSFVTIGLSIAYILLMLFVIRPLMFRVGRVYASRETMGKPIVAFVFLLILVSSLLTEAIGIHALFGAFMVGVVMPENLNFKRVFTEKIEDIALVVLLPLFFVATGLRTEIGLINSTHQWIICGGIIITAFVGKFGGTLFAARFTGMSWNHSLTLGVLMNTKGLMELIVLNIGYDLGILSPEVFAMLVIMALATTLITGPGLNLIDAFSPEKQIRTLREKTFNIMLSFANPKTGGVLLQLARQLAYRATSETIFTALHISPRSDLSPEDARVFEKESFSSIRRVAEQHKLMLNPLYRNTTEISSEIIETCESERPDFIILGSARTIFSSDILGGILKKIINETPCDVLIFNERNFSEIKSVLLVYFGNGDDYLFDYAALLNHRSERKFYAYHRGLENRGSALAYLQSGIPMESVPGSPLEPAFLQSIDLVMVAENNWKSLESKHNLPLELFPSLLIIHKGEGNNRLLQHRTAT